MAAAFTHEGRKASKKEAKRRNKERHTRARQERSSERAFRLLTPFSFPLGDSLDAQHVIRRSDLYCTAAAHERDREKCSSAIQLDRFLSPAECRHYVRETISMGYTSVSDEYPEEYRNNERVVLQCDELADHCWRKLMRCLRPSDVQAVSTSLTADSSVHVQWHPIGLNNVFRFSRYAPGSFFSPHRDGQYVHTSELRSGMTLLVYLNDSFKGGNTEFFADDVLTMEKSLNLRCSSGGSDSLAASACITVEPRIGCALVFPHHMIHSGAVVHKKSKFVMRTDVMFRAISTSIPRQPSLATHSCIRKARELLDECTEHEERGDFRSATMCYIRACEEWTKAQRFVLYEKREASPPNVRHNAEDRGSLLLALPTEILMAIVRQSPNVQQFTSLTNTARECSISCWRNMMRTCKALYGVIRHGVCWVDHAASLPNEDLPKQYRGFLDDAACDSLGFESTLLSAVDWFMVCRNARCRGTNLAVMAGSFLVTLSSANLTFSCGTRWGSRQSYSHWQCKHIFLYGPTSVPHQKRDLEEVMWLWQCTDLREVPSVLAGRSHRVSVAVPLGFSVLWIQNLMKLWCLNHIQVVNEASVIALAAGMGACSCLIVSVGYEHGYVAVVRNGLLVRWKRLHVCGKHLMMAIREIEPWKHWGWDAPHDLHGIDIAHAHRLMHEVKVDKEHDESPKVPSVGGSAADKQHQFRRIVGEALFRPSYVNSIERSIADVCVDVVRGELADSPLPEAFDNVLLEGGVTRIKGFRVRLEKELMVRIQSSVTVRPSGEDQRVELADYLRDCVMCAPQVSMGQLSSVASVSDLPGFHGETLQPPPTIDAILDDL